jgi:hypothetical protein
VRGAAAAGSAGLVERIGVQRLSHLRRSGARFMRRMQR